MSRSLFIIISLVLFAVGMIVIFSSVTLGSETANAYLRSQGGGMDTAQFMIILQEYINIYRWVGNILSVIGGLSLVKAIEPR
jgi:hypothetical protein